MGQERETTRMGGATMPTINIQGLKQRLHIYQLNSELLQLLYRSAKYYPEGDPELRERIGIANDKRNATFETIYDMFQDKQELLDATLEIVNSYRSSKKQVWYYEVALLIERNMKLKKG
jgi:hypothetical protein